MNSPARRLSRVAPAIVAVALIAGAAFATPTVALAADASPAALSVAPAADGVLATGADLTVTVEVDNTGTTSLAEGTLELALDGETIESDDAYEEWLAGSSTGTGATGADADGDADGGKGDSADESTLDQLASTPSVAVVPNGSHSVQLTVPAAELDLQGPGVYGLQATLSLPGDTVVSARTTVAVIDPAAAADPATAVAPAGVTIVAPITSVASSTGLIQPAALESFTSDTGVLTRELDALVGRPVTIAVDPRIIVSIRALGSTAPDSAVAWLQRLDQAPNPVIPLSYGDSDLSGEHQAGATSVLQPTSFDYALRPENFTDVDELIEPTATPTTDAPAPAPASVGGAGESPQAESGGSAETDPVGTESPTPTPTPSPAATVPSLEQLTAWNYTSTSIAWPRANTVMAGDLPFFGESGLTSTIVDSTQVVASDSAADDVSTPLDAIALSGTDTVLVSDHGVSRALQDALAATDETARGQATARLAGSLALAAGVGASGSGASAPGASGRPVLAVLDRDSMNLTSIDPLLATLDSFSFATTAPLDGLLETTPTQAVTVVDAPQSPERLNEIRELLAGEQRIDAFSSVLEDPAVLTGQHRANLLALLSNSWVANTGGWNVAVQSFGEATATTLDSVSVVEGSSINMVANQANLPVTISNELPYPVTVILHVTPSNGRLVVEKSDVEVTIEASSRKGAQIPLVAGVANGSVLLNLQLLSPTGVLLSTPAPVEVNVSADWETLGTVILAVLIVVVFGFGILRNILRRRRQRNEPVADGATGADAPVESPTEKPVG